MKADWQPIESAPKDGKWILIAGGTILAGQEEFEYTGVGVAAWNRRAGWVRDGADYQHRPTHWMPLPEPPTPTP